MKLLLTGSNGLTGQKIVYKVIRNKNISLLATSSGENRLKTKEGYSYQTLDISDTQAVEDIIKKFQPDVLINTAAMTNVDACELNQQDCIKINIKGVENLLQALKKYAPKCFFIHLSTDFIFDGEKGNYTEEDKPNPLSFYGQSKLKGEEILLHQAEINYAVLRTILVYGVVDNMSRSNIVLWAKQALEKNQSINVVTDQFRTPTLAEDLADACLLAANKKIKGIFNIGGKDFMSIYELVNKVADAFCLNKSLIIPSTSEKIQQPAKRPPITGFNISKAKTLLEYSPHSFEQGLEIIKQQL